MALPAGVEFRKNDEFPKAVILSIYKHKMHVGSAIGYKRSDGTVNVYPKRITVPGVFPKDQKIPIRVRYEEINWVKYEY